MLRSGVLTALIAKAIEEAYRGFMMQHQYPFCVLYFEMNSELLDVNVHPTKMELRFSQNEEIYQALFEIIRNTISHRDFIPEVPVKEEPKEAAPLIAKNLPEPFESRRIQQVAPSSHEKKSSTDAFFSRMKPNEKSPLTVQEENLFELPPKKPEKETYVQQSLESVEPSFLTEDARKKHRIIGQLFDTYWLVQFEDKLFIIDQHAAHEKVLYERTMEKLKNQSFTSQAISPPVILTLNNEEEQSLLKYKEQFRAFGYETEHFGGKEYAITSVPADFTDIDMKAMFIDMLDDFTNISGKEAPQLILEKVASMSCKAAVKGNHSLSRPEIETLIDDLLQLDNPYNCPHGRPTIISMTKYEIEKKFKRIV